MHKPTGFQATLAQVRAAYEAYYEARLTEDMTYQAASEWPVRDLGLAKARALIEGFERDGTPVKGAR